MGTYEYETSYDYEFYWKSCNNLYNFVSYYHQLNEIYETKPDSVLEIGIGNRLVYNQLKELKRLRVVSMDINAKLRPDVVGDIRSIPLEAKSFDTVCAFEVLEHIPFEDFEETLVELKRMARNYVIISIPIVRIGVDFYFKIPKHNPFYYYINIPIKLKQKPVEDDKQAHYWEVDKKGFEKKKILAIISKYFEIKKAYRLPLNKYHLMLVLKNKEMV